ncbi:hypothetical protein ACF3MZ_17470 [Paenibacillaceae bacterium WGS1546]|uniref:hypothetical protein n=1 Tax=Cohnella sp. WGS1546 TaxID=3366810 RepID=UPI00372D7054
MADFWLDFSVNTIEAFAAITLMLALFRFSLKGYVFQIVLSSIIIAQTSYLLRFVFHLDIITPIFMLAWIVLSLWRFLRIHPFYAYVMCITGYLGYIVIQTGVLNISLLWFDLDEILLFPTVKYLQLISIVITLLVAAGLMRKRIGYSFVPDRVKSKVKLSGHNLILLVLSIIGGFIVSGIAYVFLELKMPAGGLLGLCILIIFAIINASYRKEMET